jgi:hypothetical protein
MYIGLFQDVSVNTSSIEEGPSIRVLIAEVNDKQGDYVRYAMMNCNPNSRDNHIPVVQLSRNMASFISFVPQWFTDILKLVTQ